MHQEQEEGKNVPIPKRKSGKINKVMINVSALKSDSSATHLPEIVSKHFALNH